jgi:hypothetical protein
LSFGSQLLQKFGVEADTTGQLRGQVMAALEELDSLDEMEDSEEEGGGGNA